MRKIKNYYLSKSHLSCNMFLFALYKSENFLKIEGEINCETIECAQNIEWYSIFSLVATNQNDKAIGLLESIGKDSSHIFYSDAEHLTKELNK